MASEMGSSSGTAELMEPMPAPALEELVPAVSTARNGDWRWSSALEAVPLTSRKPRGRPPGSKNKQPRKPPVVARESESAMQPVLLDVAAGCDVVSSLAAFSSRQIVGVSVISVRGAVAAVTLRLAGREASAVTTLRGRFEVLMLTGTLLPASLAGAVPDPAAFSVLLAGADGPISGTLAGEMIAADRGVLVVATTFRWAEVHRLPAPGADADARGAHWQQQQLQVAGNGADVAGLGGQQPEPSS